MASRLPIPGADEGNWGVILNEFLSENLDPNSGTLKAGTVTGAQIAAGAVDTAQLSQAVQAQLNAASGGTTVASWGTITGNLNDQVDLDTELNMRLKLPLILGATQPIPAGTPEGFIIRTSTN